VPLIVVGPGIPKGVVVDRIVENVDLHSTFAELAGTSPIAADGRSLVPFLRGQPATDWRRMALIEHHRNFPDPTDPDAPIQHAADPTSYAALRLESALYVEYEDGEVGYYDLGSDPNELKNVAPSLASAKRQRLHDIVTANKACQGPQACWDAQRMSP
jgi:N-acetylglucosamine-6-sulfatase